MPSKVTMDFSRFFFLFVSQATMRKVTSSTTRSSHHVLPHYSLKVMGPTDRGQKLLNCEPTYGVPQLLKLIISGILARWQKTNTKGLTRWNVLSTGAQIIANMTKGPFFAKFVVKVLTVHTHFRPTTRGHFPCPSQSWQLSGEIASLLGAGLVLSRSHGSAH